MKKINANYTAQSNNKFPLDCETLEYIQNNRQMVEILGSIAGDKTILYGCTPNSAGTTRTEGYVFLRTKDFPTGEVLYFEGGAVQNGMYLHKTAISVTADADPYPNAYEERMLLPGLGTEQYSWSDFVALDERTNRALKTKIDALESKIASLQPSPVGSIVMWPGNNIPTNWKKCDGSTLSISEYQELFDWIGHTYDGWSSGNQFKIPNMQGCFVAGLGANNYNKLGATGGANSVALSESQMPKHNHNTGTTNDGNKYPILTTSSDGKHTHNIPTGSSTTGVAGGAQKGKNEYAPFPSSEEPSHSHTVRINPAGGDSNGNTVAHENRPPFIVMNYIIKVK